MDMIRNRLRKNYRRLKSWIKEQGIEAYRAYDKDIPDYPYIVDIYKDHAVIYEKGKVDVEETLRHRHQQDIFEAIEEVFLISPSNIVLKERKRQRGLGQYTTTTPMPSSSPSSMKGPQELLIREGAAILAINPFDYLDTGLFLDHRPMRRIIFSSAQGKRFLNLFSYTGSMSVMAALGGAISTISVDLSSTYQEWARRNFALNGLLGPQHLFIRENALNFLHSYLHTPQHEKFDLIFLDPPTFSNSKKMDRHFEVEKDQIFMIESCMRLLKGNGTLYFSCNKRSFKISPRLCSSFQIEDITSKTIPFDFRDDKIHHCFRITHSK